MTTRLGLPARAGIIVLAVAAVGLGTACASAASSPPPRRGGFAVPVVDTTVDGSDRAAAARARPAGAGRAAGAFRVRLEPVEGPMSVGSVRWLEAVVTDTLGRPVADAAVLWTSSDTSVIAVDRVGRALAPATARGEGRAVVTASMGLAAASVEVRVGAPSSAAAVSSASTFGAATGAARVVVEPRRVDAAVGEQVTLRAVALGARGDTLRACPLRWSTSGAPAAPAGGAPPGGATAVYRMLTPGPVIVTAACEGARGTAIVVVK